MREPADLVDRPGPRIPAHDAVLAVRVALRGPADDGWAPPTWLLPHQRDAARRIAGALACFSGALLADAVGLGKTYVALAVAGRYRRVTFVIPAALRWQWATCAATCGVIGRVVTHEALSRGGSVPESDLLVVDEAHRFRNPATNRYDRLARGVRRARVLLLSATPVVNRAADLVHLLRLFLADAALAPFGLLSLVGADAVPSERLLHAALPLVVARTASTAGVARRVPVARTGGVRCLPPLAPERLAAVTRALEALRFPPVPDEGRPLLYRHLLHRLASSAEAVRESLRRHRGFLRHAEEVVRRGEVPRRGALRQLLDDGDDQLALLFATLDAGAAELGEYQRELDRIAAVLALLDTPVTDPKRQALLGELELRRGRKTIVFTAARATALGIARSLGWKHVGVASAHGGRIASGPLPLADLLARFAPHAQNGGPVPDAMRLDVLVATDLASEGLNLQDADGIVHYDLPWNPFRLAQRLGRIARLGSRHAAVQVSWYRPPDALDGPLRLMETITRKAALQLALPVPVTGTVGQPTVPSETLERRERLAVEGPTTVCGHAVVQGDGGCCVLRWTGPSGIVREVVGLDQQPFLSRDVWILDAAESCGPLPSSAWRAVQRLLGVRRRAAGLAPAHPAWRDLGRRILRAARRAGMRRDAALLTALDSALERLRDGTAVGAERELIDVLARPTARSVEAWTAAHPRATPHLTGPHVEVLLAGDGEHHPVGTRGVTGRA